MSKIVYPEIEALRYVIGEQRTRLKEAEEIISELVDLIDDRTVALDSFTTQPAIIFLQKTRGDNASND